MKLNKGFTLIEILIVVAIIAILASVVLVGLGPTQQAGRDARRVSDLHEVQNGLELYYSKCGFYPGTANCGTTVAPLSYNGSPKNDYGGMATALTGSNIGVSTAPLDPADSGTHVYLYAINTAASPSTYELEATMENASGTVFSGYSAPQGTWASGDAISSCSAPNYCISL